MATKTIFEYAGGMAAFDRLTTAFYGKVVDDPLLAPVFTHMTDENVRGVALWLAEVFGGPKTYSAERGGYPYMVSQHVNRALTEAQRARWAALMIDTAAEELPDNDKLQARIASYIEWGSHIALQNSQPGSHPPKEADIPDWGWGKAGPPEDATS